MAKNYDKESQTMTITCDFCDSVFEAEGDFRGCVDLAKEDGWRTWKDEDLDQWMDRCGNQHEEGAPANTTTKSTSSNGSKSSKLPGVGDTVLYVVEADTYLPAIIIRPDAFGVLMELQVFPVSEHPETVMAEYDSAKEVATYHAR